MSIVLLGTTSGSCTLQEQAVAGTTTITLPTTSGTMALTSDIPTGVSSLNGSTGALKGMTLISTTNVSAATTIDITNIPTTAGSTYLMQIQGRTTGTGFTIFSLRYSTNNGSTFATTSYMTSYISFSDPYTVSTYMGDAIRTTFGASNIYSEINLQNGGTVNTASVYPTTYSILTAGSYEDGSGYGSYLPAPPYDPSLLDSSSAMLAGAGQVRGATFNAIRIIRRTGSQTFTGNVKLFLLGV
jgi:hypothetical protein